MWYISLLGGLVIGLSSTINLFLYKRITGMSGLIKGVISFNTDQLIYKYPTILGNNNRYIILNKT